jgi:hypothetical protein
MAAVFVIEAHVRLRLPGGGFRRGDATGSAATMGSATIEFMTVLRVIEPPAPAEHVGFGTCGSI